MKSALIVSFLLTASSWAQAEKYIVAFKTEAGFRNSYQKILSLRKSDAVNPLFEINSMILNVQSVDELKAFEKNESVLFIEKEIAHPPPRSYAPRSYVSKSFAGSLRSVSIPTFTESDNYGLKLIGAPEAWSFTKGGGARVMIIDSGVDKTHPNIAGNFERGANFIEPTADMSDVTDTIGHGTHVAGLIVGKPVSTFSGVAPEAKLLVAKVCTLEKCTNTAIVEGLNWALKEKVSVVNLSLGGGYTIAEKWAINQLDSARIPVVAATGNDGQEAIAYPAADAAVTAVGAVDENGNRVAFSNYGPELDLMAPGLSILSSVPVGTGRVSKVQDLPTQTFLNSVTYVGVNVTNAAFKSEVVSAGLGRPEDFNKAAVAGKTALIQRGEIALLEKIDNAIAAGAKGVLFYNNTKGLQASAISEDNREIKIPVAMIEKAAGEQILSRLSAGEKVQVSIEIAASDFAKMSGTSMASPYVAGVIALMRAKNPNLTSWRIRQILEKTASPMPNSEGNKNGKGLVNAKAAVEEAMRY